MTESPPDAETSTEACCTPDPEGGRKTTKRLPHILAAFGLSLAVLFGYLWLFKARTVTAIFPHHRPLMYISEAGTWRHDEGGVSVSDLTIRADRQGLTRVIPGASVTIVNDSDAPQIVAVHLALYDANLKLVATCCLKTEGIGIVRPGERVVPVEMLAAPADDIAGAPYLSIRVIRAKATDLTKKTSP